MGFLSQYDLSPEAAARLADVVGAKPGDPGWSLTQDQGGEPYGPPPPPPPQAPSGPAPGEPGFSLLRGATASPSGPAAPPSRPMTRAEETQALLSASDAARDVGAQAASTERRGASPVSINPSYAQALADTSRANEAAVRGVPYANGSRPPPSPGDADRGTGANVPAPSTPATVIPEHWQPGTNEVHTQYGYTPEETAEAMGAAGERLGAHASAEEAAYEAGQLRATRDVGYEKEYAAQAMDFRIQQQQLAQERERYVNNQTSLLNNLAEKAQREVDPDDYWKAHGGTLGKIVAAIGVGLGSFGASMNGGPNTAYEIVKNGIDANIRAQEHNIAQSGKAYDLKKSLYALNLDAFGDRDQAIKATRINYLDEAASMLDAKMADASLPLQQRQAASEMRQRVLADKESELKFFMERAHTQISQAQNERFIPRQVVGGGGAKKEISNTVTLSDGTTVQMPGEKPQTEAIAKVQTLSQLQRMNNEVLKLRAETEKLDPILDRTEYLKHMAVLKDLGEQKSSLLSKSLEQGVLRDSEYKRAMEFDVGTDTGLGLFKGNPLSAQARAATDAMLKRQTQRWEEDQRDYVKAAGGHIVERGYARDATGQLAPVGQYTGQDVKVDQKLAPKDFKPMDPRTTQPTAPPVLRDVTPSAPRFSDAPGSAATPGLGGKKRGGGHLDTRKIK
jgi:hypothetical protein